MSHRPESDIVLAWYQYDGANIEQKTIGYGWRQNQEAKLYKIVTPCFDSLAFRLRTPNYRKHQIQGLA